MTRRRSKKATRARRPVGRKAAPKRRASAASAALAKARVRIAELEDEIRRLQEQLGLAPRQPFGGRSPDRDDGPLAPGM
jgi:hypothetical protein